MEHAYIAITVPLTTHQMREKKKHNQEMLEISFSLSFLEFEDIKDCTTTNKMWDILTFIYGRDKNILRAKFESLRRKFNEIRMVEHETITQYYDQVKKVLNYIR